MTTADIARIIASIREDAKNHNWTQQEINDNYAANDCHKRDQEDDE